MTTFAQTDMGTNGINDYINNYSQSNLQPQHKQKKSLFLADLSPSCSEIDLLNLFTPFGYVIEVKIKSAEQTSKHMPFGIVKFTNNTSAETARRAMSGKIFKGKPLKIHWSDIKRDLNLNTQVGNYQTTPYNAQQIGIKNMTASIYVSYYTNEVSFMITPDYLLTLLGQLCEVTNFTIKIVNCEQNSQSGYGFLQFPNTPQGMHTALWLVEYLDNKELNRIFFRCNLSEKFFTEMKSLSNHNQMAQPHRGNYYSGGSSSQISGQISQYDGQIQQLNGGNNCCNPPEQFYNPQESLFPNNLHTHNHQTNAHHSESESSNGNFSIDNYLSSIRNLHATVKQDDSKFANGMNRNVSNVSTVTHGGYSSSQSFSSGVTMGEEFSLLYNHGHGSEALIHPVSTKMSTEQVLNSGFSPVNRLSISITNPDQFVTGQQKIHTPHQGNKFSESWRSTDSSRMSSLSHTSEKKQDNSSLSSQDGKLFDNLLKFSQDDEEVCFVYRDGRTTLETRRTN